MGKKNINIHTINNATNIKQAATEIRKILDKYQYTRKISHDEIKMIRALTTKIESDASQIVSDHE